MFRVIAAFFRQSLMKEMAFRSNFLISLLHMALNIGGAVAGIAILFSNTEELGGWDAPLALVVVGVYYLMDSLRGLCTGPSFSALSGLDGELWLGTFDFTLLKPLPPLLHVSIRRWQPSRILHIAVSIGIIVAGLRLSDLAFSPAHLYAFLPTLAIGYVILYSILLILTSAAFRYLGTPLLWILDSLLQTARYPIGIYPRGISTMLTWVIPIGFIVSVPAETLIYGIDPVYAAAGIGMAAILPAAGVICFRAGIKRYASASS